MGSAWDTVRWRDRAAQLADDLTARGVLTDRAWRTGLQTVPRHLFVPDRAWAEPQDWTGQARVIDKRAAASDWWNAVYSDASIITQRDDGATDPTDPSGTPTCSLSCPSIALEYLHLLDVNDHHRVLEVGTGTGWTAAMLAWRLGDRQVVSVEVDKDLTETATANLAAAGYDPEVVVGDGAEGALGGGPWDRVHVTCGVREIPLAWVEQTRPGGTIVAPWMPIAGAYGQRLRLDVLGDGTAMGRFAGGGGFMMLRSQRAAVPAADQGGPVARSVTRMDPRLIAGAGGGAQVMLAMSLAGTTLDAGWEKRGEEWAWVMRLADPGSGARAECSAVKGAPEFEVLQVGARRLWEEAERAYVEWLRLGRPGRERFGLSVTAEGQSVWLDHERLPGW